MPASGESADNDGEDWKFREQGGHPGRTESVKTPGPQRSALTYLEVE